MSAEVETMFSYREIPWHGQGIVVENAPTSEDAIRLAGLDWEVVKRGLVDEVTGEIIPGFVATVREKDNKVLGIVSDARYQIVQNIDGFRFTDKILGDGVTYERAGSLFDGKKVWISAKLPEMEILGDSYAPYLIFTNSHDGTGAIRACVTPVRVVCSNTLNLALERANRSWSCNHRGNVGEALHEASKTLGLAKKYMGRLEVELTEASKIDVDENKVVRFTELLLPLNKDDPRRKIEHIKEMRDEILYRWKMAPDLSETRKDGYRYLNAVSDFAVHTDLHRDTKTFKENLFAKVITGSGLYIDKAYEVLKKAN